MNIVIISQESNNQDFTTHNIHNVDKSKPYKTDNHSFNDNNFYNKKKTNHKQFNELHNQNNSIHNNEKYITNGLRSRNDYIEINLNQKHDNRTFTID